jgi:hypothetical protein
MNENVFLFSHSSDRTFFSLSWTVDTILPPIVIFLNGSLKTLYLGNCILGDMNNGFCIEMVDLGYI